MTLRTSLKNLIRRDAERPSLRERAAELRASIPASKPQADPSAPEPTHTDQFAQTGLTGSGAEPMSAEVRASCDAALIALAPAWAVARDAHADAMQRQEAVEEAAKADGRPGAAPSGSGSDWQAWFERSREWRERTGVDAAEKASGEACRTLGEIEDRIAELPAASLAGLRLKAHVAQRCNDIDLAWPDKLGDGLARDLLAFTETAAVDWHAPPPGFMAYPADDPQGFVIVREGLRLELERLHRIALAEYARKVGPDAPETKRARIRRELRLPVFESASPNGDAEILALGLDLDAAHARWRAATPAYWAAQKHVTQVCERAKARGGSAHAASVAAWKAPGIGEANDTFDAIGAELERISKAIWRTPARTPLGLAVKARATLVMVFVSGQYERDGGLGEDEDLTEQATRALIEACCSLAGVDWTGRPLGEDAPSGDGAHSEFKSNRAWAVAQAAALDLSGLSMGQLANLFEKFVAAADSWLALGEEPWLQQDEKSPYRVPNPAGRVVDREQDRAGEIRTRIAEEMRRRSPTNDGERDRRLEALIRYELLCEGNLRHSAGLRAEIARAWGG